MTGTGSNDRNDDGSPAANSDSAVQDTDAPTAAAGPPTDEDDSFPTCPTCGNEIVGATVRGPVDATAIPCGCSVVPPVLEFQD